MRKGLMAFLVGIFLVSTFLAASVSAGVKEDTMALVKKGAEFIQKNGMEKAVEAFKTGDFKQGELYLFAYDYKGTCLAQGVKPELIGKSLWNLRTVDGQYIIREQVGEAKKGGGWTEYQWMHEAKKVLMTKVTYVLPIEGMEAYVACGFYKEQ
jgi:cytochrome c